LYRRFFIWLFILLSLYLLFIYFTTRASKRSPAFLGFIPVNHLVPTPDPDNEFYFIEQS